MAKEENEEELRKEIESLRNQIDSMESMLKTLMNMHRNVLDRLTTDSDIERRYVKMLSLYQRFGRISPSIFPEIEDHVSEGIVEILLEADSCNITQLTERLRARRGSASRHTVRERLKSLEKKGIVKEVEGKQGKNYSLTRKTIDRWAEVLGIKI